MKSLYFIILITFIFNLRAYAQFRGKTTLLDKGCWTMISINEKLPYTNTDGDGNFELLLPEKLNKVFILTSWVSIEIINIPKDANVYVGEISIPMRKSISVTDYEFLSLDKKKQYFPVHCYSELLGYECKDELKETCLSFKCNNISHQICEFDFDSKNQKVIVKWENFIICTK